MPAALHDDLLFIYAVPSLLTFHNVWDVFGYLKDAFVSRGFSYYPPLTYFVIAFFQLFFKFIPIGYSAWIGEALSSLYLKTGSQNYIGILSASGVPAYLTLMKLPYLLFDMGCAFVLFKYFQDKDKSFRALKLWLLSPVVIFSSYIFGQFGIISTFLLVFAIYLIKNKKLELAAFLIGCGIMLEFYPVLFLPAILLIPDVSFRKRLKLFFISMIPTLIIFVPLYLSSDGYVKYAFLSKTIRRVMWGEGLTRRAIFIMAGKVFFISSYLFLIINLLINAFKKKGYGMSKVSVVCGAYVLMIMLLFLSTGYSPVHYLQWITPLLIIFAVDNIIPFYTYVIQIILLFIFNLDSRQLNMMLFMPVSPQYFSQLPSLHEIINRYFYWGHVITAARLLYSAVCLFMVYRIFNLEWLKRHGR